jgi:F420-dependent oxidoreductase-like protein
MRVGVHINRFNHPGGPTAVGPELAAAGAAAEAAGVSWLSVMDHYFQMEFNGGAEDAMLEAYTTLGFLAGNTSTVRLGALVTGVTYRNPGLLAKIATTLDVLSGGRATLGIGAAWYDREHAALGVPFPSTGERFERLEEALQICLQMWSDNDAAYDGKHYRLAETINLPQPPRGRIPIMIGGGGEQKTLRMVAQYAQACNLFAAAGDEGLATVKHKLDVLRGHCERLGTDYDAIEKTMQYRGDTLEDVDGFLTEMQRYKALGINLVSFAPPLYTDPIPWATQVVEKIVPRLKEV